MAYQWSGKGPDNKGEYVPMWDWLKNDSEIITFCHFILSCRGPRGTRDGTGTKTATVSLRETVYLNQLPLDMLTLIIILALKFQIYVYEFIENTEQEERHFLTQGLIHSPHTSPIWGGRTAIFRGWVRGKRGKEEGKMKGRNMTVSDWILSNHCLVFFSFAVWVTQPQSEPSDFLPDKFKLLLRIRPGKHKNESTSWPSLRGHIFILSAPVIKMDRRFMGG